MSLILDVHVRQILDSGNPTIEVDVITNGIIGATVQDLAMTNMRAVELREDKAVYMGKEHFKELLLT
jgi:enolase